MKIAMAQIDVEQGDFEKNLKKADKFAKNAKKDGADLIVFPEMFLCGFNYNKNLQYLETNGNLAEIELCKIAKNHSIALCGSIPHLAEKSEIPSNRFLFIDKNGIILATYDKIHLFSVFNENKYVKAGDEIVVAKTPFGDAGFAICYDLRFPDIFVRMTKRNAKFIVIVAAFPHPRSEHWRILCRARAIENQCFVIAVNQSGLERFGTNEVKYFGMSAIIDPWGGVVAECGEYESLVLADINLEDVEDIRSQISAVADRRDDIY